MELTHCLDSVKSDFAITNILYFFGKIWIWASQIHADVDYIALFQFNGLC